VAWFDPRVLDLSARGAYGLRQEQFLAKDGGGEAEAGIARYEAWKRAMEEAIETGGRATMLPLRASEALFMPDGFSGVIDEVKLSRLPDRPGGRRFGTLVHAILRDVPLDADRAAIEELAEVHGRVLGASAGEVAGSIPPVVELLSHDLLARARSADRVLREHPILFETEDGTLLDGTIDLLFYDRGRWTVVDFKTDADVHARRDQYLRQMAWYSFALEKITGRPVHAILLAI
jgi:hypothetical protein